jgi:hypothetical protein
MSIIENPTVRAANPDAVVGREPPLELTWVLPAALSTSFYISFHPLSFSFLAFAMGRSRYEESRTVSL